jgi:hypothetical protein
VEVEATVEPRVFEQSEGGGDVAGEAEVDAEVPGASASVEQDGESAVVDAGNLAEVDHELFGLAGEGAVSRSAELGRVRPVEFAADQENGASAVGPVRDLERAIRPLRLAR